MAQCDYPRGGPEGSQIRRRGVKGLLYAIPAVVLALVMPAVASAATLKVAEDGVDAGTCLVDACKTLGYAVEQATDGDTVQVAAGSYVVDSPVILNKAVSLLGAQAGIDARHRNLPVSAETVITPSGSFPTAGAPPIIRMSAPGATVDGVTISGHSRAAVQMMSASSGYTVRNSILAGNRLGIDLETTAVDPEPTLIEGNRFEAAGETRQEMGIYGDYTASDVTIRANSFVNHVNVPINISGGERNGDGPNRIQKNLLIEGNHFESERHLILWTADGVRIRGNTFTNGRTGGQAIAVQGGVKNLEISGNLITNIADAGILFVDYYGDGPNSSTVISGNTIIGANSTELTDSAGIAVSTRTTDGPGSSGDPGYAGTLTVTGNRIVDNGIAGLRNDVAGASVNAQNNWWGCNAGPAGAGCDATASSAGAIESEPHLVLTMTTAPASVQVGGSATVTAALNSNSAGQSVTTPVPDGIAVSFETTSGSVTPPASQLNGGVSQAQFVAANSAGVATVSAAVDSEIVRQQITVTAPPPAPKPPADDVTPPPAPKPPAPREVRNRASRALGNPRVTVRPVMSLGPLRVMVPTQSARHRVAKPRIPVVAGNRVKVNRRGITRRVRQRLAALGSFRGAQRVIVAQTVRIGRRNVALPRQRLGLGAGQARAVTLPITNPMRRLLLRGRRLVLTLRITAVDQSGKSRTAVKRFRIEGEKARK